MKIARCAPIAITAPYTRPSSEPGDTIAGSRNCVWFRIVTTDGVVGWEEAYVGCYGTAALAATDRLSQGLERRDASDPEVLLEDIRFHNRYWAMRGVGAQATSAIEGALWDAVGQTERKPVWKLLGNDVPQPVLVYASVGDDHLSPEVIFEEASLMANLGYRAYKMRCGGTRFDKVADRFSCDLDRVAAARQALGPDRAPVCRCARTATSLCLGYTLRGNFMRALIPHHVEFLEEPVRGRFEDGYMLPSERSGLGLDITEDWLRQFTYPKGRERDY